MSLYPPCMVNWCTAVENPNPKQVQTALEGGMTKPSGSFDRNEQNIKPAKTAPSQQTKKLISQAKLIPISSMRPSLNARLLSLSTLPFAHNRLYSIP